MLDVVLPNLSPTAGPEEAHQDDQHGADAKEEQGGKKPHPNLAQNYGTM